MSDKDRPTVDITITADTSTAEAVLKAVEELAEDEDVDTSGIKHIDVSPTDWKDLQR